MSAEQSAAVVDHVAAAQGLLDKIGEAADTNGALSAPVVAAVAQVHATLALVEQQRVLNLTDWLDRLPRVPANNEIRAALREEIARSLGLVTAVAG